MKRILAALLCAPTLAMSDPLGIRSGEHETFSRLVLSIPEGADWSVAEGGRSVTLSVATGVDGFAINEIFERIPRTRIEDVSQPEAGRLELALGCDCEVDAFLWRADRLVLDIVDPQPVAAKAPDDLFEQPAMATGLPNTFLEQWIPSPFPSDAPVASVDVPAMEENPVSTAAELPTTNAPASTGEAEVELLEQIARAASQGFLTAENPIEQTLDQVEDPPQPDLPTVAMVVDSTPARSIAPGIGVSNSIDENLRAVQDAIEAQTSQTCLPDDVFDLASWADDRPFHAQSAERLSALVGDFGIEPLSAQDDLARLYIYFGFGAEALQVLGMDSATSRSRSILRELAMIVDDRRGDMPLVESQAGCDTTGGMLAFLIDPTPLDAAQQDQTLQNYLLLPQPFRDYLAAPMSDAFLDVNAPEAADRILRGLDSFVALADSTVPLVQADLAAERDDPEEAIALLSEQLNDSARATPEAAVRLIDLKLENEKVPTEAELVTLSALAREYRNDPIMPELVIAEAKGWLARREYDQALALLGSLTEASTAPIVNDIYGNLAQNGEHTEFLTYAFGEVPSQLSAATENELARRLVELGFPDRALVLMRPGATGAAMADRRYIRAEANIALGNAEEALSALQGLTNQRAQALRTQAYSLQGDFQTALNTVPADIGEEEQLSLQLRAGDWDGLSEQSDDALSAFAATTLSPAASASAETLSERRDILEQSSESRRAIESLLERFDIPDVE